MSTEEENMALSRRLMEARVKGDLDAVDEMLTPDFVTHINWFPANSPVAKAKNGRSPNSLLPSPPAG